MCRFFSTRSATPRIGEAKMLKRDVPYYLDFIPHELYMYLRREMRPVTGVPGLEEVGAGGGLESPEALQFLCTLYERLKRPLNTVLKQRAVDREFLDQRTRACYEYNRSLGIDFLDPKYATAIGQEDARGRVVVGPKTKFYCRPGGGAKIAALPERLDETHVTLFGPPDDPKLSINAMNCYHRKLPGEPAIVEELLKDQTSRPKWGADDEDSKTPLREDLISAGRNLTGCFDGTLSFTDEKTRKVYVMENEHLALPIKRFPGLALPSTFLFYKNNPLPLHLYDFALHLFKNWNRPEALSFYVPKLETEEEAAYIRLMMKTAEEMIAALHPEYEVGTIRLFIVLENPRAIFRVNEIMDALHPYFAGASLGWHDYLSSTARLFKEDANYRIPVKADPEIVIKYIKASHDLLAEVVGPRGGVKIGGMYGVLPTDTDLKGDSFQVTMKGFIKDVVTQMKRRLSGYWVAHPDFVRIGLALVEAWKQWASGQKQPLETLVTSLLVPKHHEEILNFIRGSDIVGLDRDNEMYPRSLLVADLKESTFIANNHPDEIRYNIFQSLQYLTDWLSGNGCVALPAQIEGVPVRVMDDLATAERSRWEVWAELHHGRFATEDFLRIVHEEMHFIRKDLSNDKKIVQVKWNERTEKWYPIAMRLMLQLMTADAPVEFASELLLPFAVESIRKSEDPWAAAQKATGTKYTLDPYVVRFCNYFSACGVQTFAESMASNLLVSMKKAETLIKNFTMEEVIAAASFHGDIGESKKTLEATAAKEQAEVLKEAESVKEKLRALGARYKGKFGVKFLISAQGKSASEILAALEKRLESTAEQELENARTELWEITRKRLTKDGDARQAITLLLGRHKVVGAQIAVTTGHGPAQTLCFGHRRRGAENVTARTWFELASLSKTVATAFALEYFTANNVRLDAKVNELLAKAGSSYRIKDTGQGWADQVQVKHLMNHSALNLHYVNGVPASLSMPNVSDLLNGNTNYGYQAVQALRPPGETFSYSGGGFLVLEHLLEALTKKSVQELTRPFFSSLGLENLIFEQKTLPKMEYATGYLSEGEEVEGSRKMFPAFAAGAMGTAADMSAFLMHLTESYRSLAPRSPISHSTAVQMLHGANMQSREFMGVDIGLGVFTAQAGPNRLAIHQGANDGFRALFVHCYDGPDRGKGFTIFCNGDNNGVRFVSEAAQVLLKELDFKGVDPSLFAADFQSAGIPQEQIVNQTYKEMIFKAFVPDLPEAIGEKGERNALANFNLSTGAKILSVTNQGFARAENILSANHPVFDPELFGRQGKIMDSWETIRHNAQPPEILLLELKRPSVIHYLSLSTRYHLGNQAEWVEVEGRSLDSGEWKTIVPKIRLDGHALKKVVSADTRTIFKHVRVKMYPDGGLTRLGLFDDGLPGPEREKFQPADKAKSEVFTDAIPKSLKPLTPIYKPAAAETERLWKAVKHGQEVDAASAAYGGKVLKVTNEHFGPAAQVISPYPPINMFDGFESARSREPGHSESLQIALGKPVLLRRLQFDFTYFRNNNPCEISVFAVERGKRTPLIERAPVKAFAGNIAEFPITHSDRVSEIEIQVFPDGGINRVRAFGISP